MFLSRNNPLPNLRDPLVPPWSPQAGFPVKLLSVQYRMHPEIRAFPSRHFYDNRLIDGKCVLEQPPASFYAAEVRIRDCL